MKTNLRNQRGFTLIELVVVMVILALLAAVAVPKFLDLQKQAEAASVKKVIGNLRSALSIRVAQAIVDGEDVATLAYTGAAATNLEPMGDLLSNKPESYRGLIANSTTPGDWFDDTDGYDSVVYVIKNAGIVSIDGTPNTAGQQLRYQITAITDTVNGNTVTTGLELVSHVGAATSTLIWNY